MTIREFAADLLSRLPYHPNDQQMRVALALAKFCARSADNTSADRVFILNGYAGTGKTTLIGALVKALQAQHITTILMAPTGRAAKVFASGAAAPAHTIHRKIYRHALPGTAQTPRPQENRHNHAIFIVDEASMIATDNDQGANLLTDLIHYTYTGNGCRLILLGDTAQLPPVGQSESPAMNPDTLRGYGLKVTTATITQVARQTDTSGILRNATRLRRALAAVTANPSLPPVPVITGTPDVTTVTPEDLPDLLDTLYRTHGPDETIVITRSNRTATQFNKAIRTTVLDREEELTRGDRLIAVKNNYHWARGIQGLDFIANGEILTIHAVHTTEIRYGLRFADVSLTTSDRPDHPFDAKIILDCLHGDSPALDSLSTQQLWQGAYNDPDTIPPDTPHHTRLRLMRQSSYVNALQVKYAYAVTCHKAQGGQWHNVLIDLSYIPPQQIGHDFYRWLYTAITRARTQLYLINPPEALIQPVRT